MLLRSGQNYSGPAPSNTNNRRTGKVDQTSSRPCEGNIQTDTKRSYSGEERNLPHWAPGRSDWPLECPVDSLQSRRAFITEDLKSLSQRPLLPSSDTQPQDVQREMDLLDLDAERARLDAAISQLMSQRALPGESRLDQHRRHLNLQTRRVFGELPKIQTRTVWTEEESSSDSTCGSDWERMWRESAPSPSPRRAHVSSSSRQHPESDTSGRNSSSRSAPRHGIGRVVFRLQERADLALALSTLTALVFVAVVVTQLGPDIVWFLGRLCHIMREIAVG